MCDRIALINEGKIVACGSLDELCSLLQKRQIIEVSVVGLTGGLEKKIRSSVAVDSLKVEINEPVMGEGRIRLLTKDPDIILPVFLEVCDSLDLKILGIDTSGPRLEDVFVEFFS